jgi:hypothetical protein
MSQYRDGTVTVQLGNSVVTGIGTAWLSNIQPGHMLIVGVDGPAAFVASVVSDTVLHLEIGWPGVSLANTAYAIVRDFDPTSGAPLMARGDVNVLGVFNRAVAALSVQTAVAVEGSEAVQQARAARDDAQAARDVAVAAGTDAAALAATLARITVSTAAPSGGAVGDIWFQTTA